MSALKVGFVCSCCMLLFACGAKPEPTSAAQPATQNASASTPNNSAVEIKTLYNRSCVSCHLSGVAGAPRQGDTAEWERRMALKDMPALIQSVRKGLGAMPPMGMCPQCSDAQIEALIHYMREPKS